MKNYIQSGDAIDVVTPSGGYTSGNFYKQGLMAGVAVLTTLEGEKNVLNTRGVYSLPKETGTAWTLGDQLYWDAGNSRFTKTAGENISHGIAADDAASGAATGLVKLAGAGGASAGPIAQQAAEPDLSGALTGAADGVLADVAAAAGACAGGAEPSAAQVDAAIATAVATIVSGVNEQNKEFQTKINALLAKLRLAGVVEDA